MRNNLFRSFMWLGLVFSISANAAESSRAYNVVKQMDYAIKLADLNRDGDNVTGVASEWEKLKGNIRNIVVLFEYEEKDRTVYKYCHEKTSPKLSMHIEVNDGWDNTDIKQDVFPYLHCAYKSDYLTFDNNFDFDDANEVKLSFELENIKPEFSIANVWVGIDTE